MTAFMLVRLQLGLGWGSVRVSCSVRFSVRISFTVRVSVRVIQVAISVLLTN